MNRVVTIIFLMLAVAGFTSAQGAPALVNYQGRLTDAQGEPLPTGDYSLTIRIYDAPAGGLLVWGPQIFDGGLAIGHGGVVPVVGGYFNLMLGPADTDGHSLLDATNGAFNSASRYLEVTVGAGQPILPRQQVLAAPYAVTAVRTQGTSNLFPGDGNVGIGTTSPESPLTILGNQTVSALSLNNAHADGPGLEALAGDGSGTTRVLNAGTSSGTPRFFVQEDGKVAVGNITPASTSLLDVAGNLNVRGQVQWDSQKICYVGSTGNTYAFAVPPTFTIANCNSMRSQPWGTEAFYVLGCVFANSHSFGNPPSPNCGW